MTEGDLMRLIMRECGKGNVRLLRNNVGKLPDRYGRFITYGLGIGSSDLIGVKLRADGVGQMVAIEVKLPGKKPTLEQRDFLIMVEAMGGLSGIAHSVQEAKAILSGTAAG
jgi:hypothetical protein